MLRNVRARLSESEMARFGGNAHVRRGLSDDSLWDGFWVFGGSDRSQTFERAVPVDRGDRHSYVHVGERLAVALGGRQDAAAGHRVVHA